MSKLQGATLTRHDPLTYRNGEILFSEQFLSEKVFLDADKAVMQGNPDRLQDIGCFLYFVESSQSIYRQMFRKERVVALVSSGRLRDHGWLKSVAKKKEFKELVLWFRNVSRTPSEKMRDSLLKEIERYIEEIATVLGSDDVDHLRLVEKGKKLHTALKDVERMCDEDRAKARVKSGYKPRRYEVPKDQG